MLVELLRGAREGKGWTREDLAARAGVSPQLVKRLELGTGSVATLLACMRATELHLTKVARGTTLVDQIANARRARGWSAQHAARRAGISRATLAAIERGEGTVAPLEKLLAAVAPGATPAKPARASWNGDRAADRDKRFTPAWFLAHVVDAFGPIDLDPCGHELSSVVAGRVIAPPDDGLSSSWAGARLAFVNPPFSDLTGWLNRAVEAFERGECEKVVVLIPTRTDSATFHDRVAPLADVAFLRGRMTFATVEGSTYPAPFAMMVLVFGGTEAEIEAFDRLARPTWLRRAARSSHAGEARSGRAARSTPAGTDPRSDPTPTSSATQILSGAQ